MVFYFRNLVSKGSKKDFFQKILEKTVEFKPELDSFEISLVLVGNQKIRAINKKHLESDRITDVLSFDLGQGIAEIFISQERAQAQSKELGHSLNKELATLFVHGLLHILGHEDQSKEDRQQMFLLQDRIIKKLAEEIV